MRAQLAVGHHLNSNSDRYISVLVPKIERCRLLSKDSLRTRGKAVGAARHGVLITGCSMFKSCIY